MGLLLVLLLLQGPTLTVTNMADGGTFRTDTLRLQISAPQARRLELWLIQPPSVSAGPDLILSNLGPATLAGSASLSTAKLVALKENVLGNMQPNYVALEWGERSIPVGIYLVRVVACTGANACTEKLMYLRRIQ